MHRRIAQLFTAAAVVAFPASAHAGAVMLGSDLSADATLTQSHPRDWAAWPTALASGGAVRAPDYGEVSTVQFKGTVRKATDGSAPPFAFMVVVLRPQPTGAVKLTGISGDLFALPGFPFGAPADTITTYNLQDYSSRVCVEPGDYVGIATNGGFGPGFYDDGYPVQMFGRVAGSATAVHEEPANDGNGFQAGDTETGTVQEGRELLLRVTVKTEKDARYTCWSPALKASQGQGGSGGGGGQKPAVALPKQAFRLPLDAANKVGVQLSCASTQRACNGQLYLKHNDKPVGVGKFSLAAGAQGAVPIQINANGLRLLKQGKGRLKVTAIVRLPGVEVQQRSFKLIRGQRR